MGILGGQPRDNEDHVYRFCTGATQWAKIEDLDIEWTKEDWLDEVKGGNSVIRDIVKVRRKKARDVDMILGFAEINGERGKVRK